MTDGTFFLNNNSFAAPDVPVLLQILSGNTPAQQLLPVGGIIELPRNKTIEISFPMDESAAAFPHPIHLHGVSIVT